MAIPGNIQALIAAFAFGIVVNAASAALFLHVRCHGSRVYRDGLRLVLTLFLFGAALWAQVDFIATVIDPTATGSCQVAVGFSTAFDQLARFSLEQFLLWGVNSGSKSSAADVLVPQALLLGRFIVGAVFVGLSRPQFNPVCVARTSILPVGVAVVAVDAVVILALLFRAVKVGLVKDVRQGRPGAVRSKALLWVLVGLTIWTGASVPMTLGIESIDLIVRTAIPAAALSILVGIVTTFANALVISRARASMLPPDAPSPTTRDIRSRDLSTSDSDYPPSRYEDLKGEEIMTVSAFVLPRNAPRPEENTRNGQLPSIMQPGPGQAMAGVGGVPVTGQLFPPMRSETAPPLKQVMTSRANSVRPKKGGLFGGSSANGAAGKLVISNPIVQDEQNPLKKIATIDLATAARHEQERREQALQRSSSLIAKRPAPQPPNLSPEEVAKRAQSIKRKEVASMTSNDGLKPLSAEVPPTDLMPRATATTSSAQLSPGVEELRRRSPRQPPGLLSEKEIEFRLASPVAEPERPVSPPRRPVRPTSPAQPAQPTEMLQSPVARPPPVARAPSPEKRAPSPEKDYATEVMSRQASIRANIRPSRQRPRSPPAVVDEEQLKDIPAVQKRTAAGLPSNPRAQAMRTLAKEAGLQQEQTVMFVNNIEYNDPTMVESIIQGANDRAKAGGEGVRPSASVVNRPRPVPRKPEKDRPLFPAEPSPNQHKRTKSGASTMSRRSILQSHPGSPTQLPPLPPPPKAAGNPLRPLPNDTKSMTFDEKMTLLFPQPPLSGGSTMTASTQKRRSSVPELPALPASFLDLNKSPGDRSEGSDGKHQSKHSDRTSKTSLLTQSVLEINEIPRLPEDRNVSQFSVDTFRNLTDEVGQSWLPGISTESDGRQSSYVGVKRQSSPVLGVRPASPSEFSDVKTRDGAVSDWASVHSPVAAVSFQQAKLLPKATLVASRDPNKLSYVSQADGRESMPIMLDPTTPHDRDLERETWYEDGHLPELGGSRQGGQWHRRVGDECPSFSEREKTRSRKMVPPTPLLLNLLSNKNNIVVPAPEPSPLESPQQALEMIQQQLKKLDQPDRESMASQGQRLALLENLELEMGQQENHWLELQHDLSRDSLSTIRTSPNRDSVIETTNNISMAREASLRINIAADRRASRRAAMKRTSVARQSTDMTSMTPQSADITRANVWQQRLAEAQAEYMDNASDLLAKRKLNSVALSKAQLGSPTPPDTDESETDDLIDSRIMSRKITVSNRASVDKKLWAPTPTSAAATPSTAVLWTPAPQLATNGENTDLPRISVRPVSRRSFEPLAIESGELWQSSTKTRPVGNIAGLWRESQQLAPPVLPESPLEPEGDYDEYQSQSQKAPRPLTQRPPRRSRRMTLLPDILESPEPLPDKRGTLGIFQFPWGEKSDTATIHTRPSGMFMAMPGTMSSGVSAMNASLEVRSKQLEAQEYSSSFFDDYDDDEDVSDIEQEGSDDGFDDATLWEIANLLKTDQVPSKDSLLPRPYKGRAQALEVDDYLAEALSDEEDGGDAKHDSIVVAIEVEDFPVPPSRDTRLWDGKSGKAKSAQKGLAQPDDGAWKKYIPSAEGAVRIQARKATDPASIQSQSLWNAAHKLSHGRQASHLWSHKMSMWTVPVKTKVVEPLGLFSPSHKRTDFRQTAAEPAAINMIRKPRVSREPLPRLTSTKLWSAMTESTHGHHWISNKSVPKASLVNEFEMLPSSGVKQPAWWEAKPVRYQPRNAPSKAASSQRSRQPIRRQHRPSVVIRADWDAALEEAIAASYPDQKVRQAASAADWDAALVEAISAGRRVRKAATKKEWEAALNAATAQVQSAMPSEEARMMRRQQTKSIAAQRRLSRSDSGGRRRKEEILAQIRAIENGEDVPAALVSPAEERQPSKRAAIKAQIQALEKTETHEVRVSSHLWLKPTEAASPVGQMWVPKAHKAAQPEMELPPSDAESEGLRRKQKEQRKAEILAQINAIENGMDPASLGLGFGGMWSRLDGDEMRSRRSRGGDRDWLAYRRPNRVQFRY